MKQKMIILFFLFVLLGGCATEFRPRLGMNYAQFRHHYLDSAEYIWSDGKLRLVYAEDNIEAYTLDDGRLFYFRDGLLYKIDMGQKEQERIQLEIINK